MGLVIKDRSKWWTNGVVPFRIKMNDFTAAQVTTIRQAITRWESTTLVRFVPISLPPLPGLAFVTFQKHNKACDSKVGKQGSDQAVRCDLSSGDFTAGSITHEIGHMLGFYHEHQRPDRDAVVAVSQSEITSHPENFQRIDDQLPVGEYDCQSIMHYSADFAKITNIDHACAGMGQRDKVSAGDIDTINFMNIQLPLSTPIGIHNQDGRIELFAIDNSSRPWHRWQTAPNKWFGSWDPLGGVGRQPFPIRNSDERIELFVIGEGGAMLHRWQTAPNGPFADWQSLGGNVSQPFAVHNQDRRIELFAIGAGSDRAVWHRWQTAPNGPFADWHSLGGDVRELFAIPNQDGRIELFAIDNRSGAMLHRWQTAPNGSFADWYLLGGTVSQPFAIRNQDGRIELFAIGTDGVLWHRWQTAPNSYFADWSKLD